jgi:phytoene dehydrogenase-like protein
VPAGGTQALTDALVGVLGDQGVKVETGVPVTSLDELTGARLVLFDTSPRAVAEIVGNRLPAPVRRALTRDRPGPAAHKVDLVVDGGLPWTAPQCRKAGTVHLGGSLEEVVRAEADVHQGCMPERPFVVLAQPALADPHRAAGELRPVEACAHVPRGFDGDATDAVLGQIERFAPGARERIVAVEATPPAARETMDLHDLRRRLLPPRLARDPYGLGVPGMYLCSAATPPGGGVHGLCGRNAARQALRDLAHPGDLDHLRVDDLDGPDRPSP